MKKDEKKQMEELEAEAMALVDSETEKFNAAQKQAAEFSKRMIAGGVEVDYSAHDEPIVGFPRDWSVNITFRVEGGCMLDKAEAQADHQGWWLEVGNWAIECCESPEAALLEYIRHITGEHAHFMKKIEKERRELEVLGVAMKGARRKPKVGDMVSYKGDLYQVAWINYEGRVGIEKDGADACSVPMHSLTVTREPEVKS